MLYSALHINLYMLFAKYLIKDIFKRRMLFMQEFNKVRLNYKCDTSVLLFSRCLVWGQFDWMPWGLIM